MDFDIKQKKLINSWHSLSEDTKDSYMAFMAEWIALNAICYNLYYSKAVKERANIDSNRNQLKAIRENLLQAKILSATKTTIQNKNNKWKVNINFPDSSLNLSITNNYTEDIIFNEFVKGNEKWYNENKHLTNEIFEKLRNSLKKESRSFVINMTKILLYVDTENIDDLADRNVVILCEENNLKTVKNVLYQIRCNIFHGEKTPGNINDDRIVKSSLPLLRYLVNKLLDDFKIKNCD